MRAFAMPTGALLGWIAWELSRVPDKPTYNLAMALILVVAGCASFVFGALHFRSATPGATRQILAREARLCVLWLGCGVALGINALQLALS